MKIFANKKIWKKMIFAIGLIALIGILLPRQVNAGIGGTLITPIVDLFTGLADGVQTLIHKIFVKQDVVLYLISEGINWWGVAIGILLGIVLVATGVITIQLAISVAAITLVLSIAGVQNVVFNTVKTISADMLSDKTIALPTFTLTPYEIFTSEEGVFSVNFFREKEEKKGDDKNIILSLNQNIRDWYKTLRLIAIVGMMSVLVYIGIRILLSSTAESNAKYKQMMWDWLVATFLIFTMQYIMVFANIMVDTLTDTLGTIKVETEVVNSKTGDKLKKSVNKDGVEGYIIGVKQSKDGGPLEIDTETTDLVKKAYKQLVKSDTGEAQDQFKHYFYSDSNLSQEATDEVNANVLFWPADNFATQARMNAQLIRNSKGNDTSEYIGYALVYVALTVYTVIFIFVYIKRYIYMVFLTLISPLVALTYPIDKVKDGQAQAFNFWFKEYLYNLLLQPLHLILYMLLIGSAMRFAASNPLYVIVCLGFMVPAEKILKAMFGFKGQTPGSMPGVATAALMMHATRNLFSKQPKAPNSLNGGSGGSSGKDDIVPVKTLPTKPFEESDMYEDRSGGSLAGGSSAGGSSAGGSSAGGSSAGGGSAAGSTAGGSSAGGSSAGGGSAAGSSAGGSSAGGSSAGGSLAGGGSAAGSSAGGGSAAGSSAGGGSAAGSSAGGSSAGGSSAGGSSAGEKISWPRAVGRATINGVKGRISNTIGSGEWWKNTGKTTAKTAVKTASGIAWGAIGATGAGIAGIVSGDPSKAIENMTVAGIAGYKFGSGTGEVIANGVGNFVDSVSNEYYAGRKGDYDQKQMDRYIKNWKKDQNNMAILKRNQYDKDQYQNLINNNGIDEYIKHGFSDAKDMAAAERFAKENKLSRKEAINVLQMNKQIAGGNFTDLHEDDKDKWRRDMKKRFRNAGKDEPTADRYVKKAEKYLEDISSIRTKIQ